MGNKLNDIGGLKNKALKSPPTSRERKAIVQMEPY